MTEAKRNSIFTVKDPEDKKMLNQLAYRGLKGSCIYSYDKMQALDFLYAMTPVINRYYSSKQDRADGYSRHFELYNCNPRTGAIILGIAASMEKVASEDPSFDKDSINNVKVSLMGPLAGIGDSIFWGSLRIISLSIGISLCAKGNPLGILVHILLYNVPAVLVNYYGVFAGFNLGTQFMAKANESGILQLVTEAAQIVGMMTIGAMAVTMTSINIPLVFTISGSEVSLQELLDSIFPCLLPLLLTLGCYKLLKKNVSPILLMIGLMLIGVIGKAIGLF